MSVQDIDRGWKRIRAEMRKMAGSYTKVGVQSDAKRDDSANAATVAAVHEFGGGNVPERSFLRSTMDENRESIKKLVAAEKDAIFAGRSTVERSLGLIGAWAVAKVQAKIRSRIPPPLAPSTLARRKNKDKSSVVPLIDTGQLIQSIRQVVVMGGRK